MPKFHIKPDGTPALCKATKGKCPYGGEESHYNSKEEAYEAFQNKMENKEIVKPENQVYLDKLQGWSAYTEDLVNKEMISPLSGLNQIIGYSRALVDAGLLSDEQALQNARDFNERVVEKN
jgi:hypothetical protein